MEVFAEEVPAGGPRRGNSIAVLQPLRLKLQQHWPLSLIVQDSHMEQYNDVLAFLLQVGPSFLAQSFHTRSSCSGMGIGWDPAA